MRCLIVDPYGGNPCPISEPLLHLGYEVHQLTFAEKARANLPKAVALHLRPQVQLASCSRGIVNRLTARRRRGQIQRQNIQTCTKLVSQVKPDLVFSLDIELGTPIALKAAPGLPNFGVSLGSDVYVVPERDRAQREAVIHSLNSVRGVLALTESHAARIRELSARDSFVIGGWIDRKTFESATEGVERVYPPYVLSLRGSRDVYRPEVVLEAAAIARSRQDFVLRFLCSPEDCSRLRAHAKRHGLPDQAIEWVTERIEYSRMPAVYAGATVVLQALKNESLGYTAIEAMTAGCVIVQPDSPVVREIVPASQYVLLSDADPKSLAQKLVHVLEDDQLSQRVGADNARHALEKFDRVSAVPRTAEKLKLWLESRLREVTPQ